MNNVNKTLYIPLYGKAYVSKKGLFICDKKAEEIWKREGFALNGRSKSRWLAYYMGIRAAVFDNWLKKQMYQNKNAIVLHIGCGMDSRIERVGTMKHIWYDVDFPEVIEERRKYYSETSLYRLIEGDARKTEWLQNIPEKQSAIIVMEGISMYLTSAEIKSFINALTEHFNKIALLMDCYTVISAKLSRYRNPINDVGVTTVYGIDEPKKLSTNKVSFTREYNITPNRFTNELQGIEKLIFKSVYAGAIARKMYRLFEYKSI